MIPLPGTLPVGWSQASKQTQRDELSSGGGGEPKLFSYIVGLIGKHSRTCVHITHRSIYYRLHLICMYEIWQKDGRLDGHRPTNSWFYLQTELQRATQTDGQTNMETVSKTHKLGLRDTDRSKI